MKSTPAEPISERSRLIQFQNSASDLIKSLYSLKKSDKHKPILGAHVLSAVLQLNKGVAARAFRGLGIDRENLAKAVSVELC